MFIKIFFSNVQKSLFSDFQSIVNLKKGRENGILLSPNIDSLFDKHLISFEDDGSILISDKLDSLNINDEIKIPVNEGMKKYLKRHREKFNK